MATIVKKQGKWFVQIRRSFHKPIYKSFISIYIKIKRDMLSG